MLLTAAILSLKSFFGGLLRIKNDEENSLHQIITQKICQGHFFNWDEKTLTLTDKRFWHHY